MLAPPSAGYTLLQGDLRAIPFLSCEERAALLDTARQFSRVPLVCAPRTATTQWRYATQAHRPGDDYNRRGDVVGILERHGWRCVRHVQEASYWRRPGKRRGHSATYNYRDLRYFYVFTSNAPPFDHEVRPYPLRPHSWQKQKSAFICVPTILGASRGALPGWCSNNIIY